MINLQETKERDLVWLEENGRSVLARVVYIHPYPEVWGGRVDVELEHYALVFEKKFDPIKKNIPVERLTKAEGAPMNFCLLCELAATDIITKELGEALPDTLTMFTIRSAVTHAILTELRRRNVTL